MYLKVVFYDREYPKAKVWTIGVPQGCLLGLIGVPQGCLLGLIGVPQGCLLIPIGVPKVVMYDLWSTPRLSSMTGSTPRRCSRTILGCLLGTIGGSQGCLLGTIGFTQGYNLEPKGVLQSCVLVPIGVPQEYVLGQIQSS